MTRTSDLKRGIRIAKKLKYKKPFTINEFRTLKKEGLIRGKPGNIKRTKKGTDFIKRVDRLGFI